MPSIPNSIVKKQKKINILFYHGREANPGTVWLYPTVLELKTYIDLFYPSVASELEWLVPIMHEVSDQQLIDHIQQNNVDLLCTSHYLWNHTELINQLASIKNHCNPNLKIIAGGPSIDVNANNMFFEQHPYIDYAVYGPGEQAFADIVNHLVLNKPLIAFNTSNCGWKNHSTGKTIVADYKFVKMTSTSPWLHNKKMLESMVAESKKSNKFIRIPYTLTRGCPYSCTFCDWNSGLGNKVSRRKNTYQQEIDLFHQLGINTIYLSDANVGQYNEDVDMIEYFAQKNTKENANFIIGGNFSKLKKENNLKIYHIMAKNSLVNKALTFSIQDPNEEVLNNIDRPDVGWDVHLNMAQELQQCYPHITIKAALIYGLPGQTPITWRQSLEQVTKQRIFPKLFLNEPLAASPAMYDPEYQRKFQFEYIYSNRVAAGTDVLYGGSPMIYNSKIPKQCISFSQQDLVKMTVLGAIYFALSIVTITSYENNGPSLDITFVVDDFLDSVYYQRLYNNLLTNWTMDNNFYYTTNFSGPTNPISEITMGYVLFKDSLFIEYLTTFFSVKDQQKFLELVSANKFKELIENIWTDMD